MTFHTETYWSPDRVRARSEAARKSRRLRRAGEAEVVAAVQQLLDAGYATATYKKGNKLTFRNLVSITLTDKGKRTLQSIRAGSVAIGTLNAGFENGWYEWAAPQEAEQGQNEEPIGRWRNTRTGKIYNYKSSERFGTVLVGVKGSRNRHRILAEHLEELKDA